MEGETSRWDRVASLVPSALMALVVAGMGGYVVSRHLRRQHEPSPHSRQDAVQLRIESGHSACTRSSPVCNKEHPRGIVHRGGSRSRLAQTPNDTEDSLPGGAFLVARRKGCETDAKGELSASASANSLPRRNLSSGRAGHETPCSSGGESAEWTRVATNWAPEKRMDPYDRRPRSAYLVWDDYFMAIAFLSAMRSKDPNRQVGACIVSPENIILGIGYNGFPRGCPDSELPWSKASRTGNSLETKYPYVCHAEMNAIMNKNTASLAGARIFVTLFPCNECAKLIIQSGLSEVIFYEDKNIKHDAKVTVAT